MLSIIFTAVMVYATIIAYNLTTDNRDLKSVLMPPSELDDRLKVSLVFAIVAGVAHYLIETANVNNTFITIAAIGLVAVYIYIMYWWHEVGNEYLEMVPFIGMTILMYFPLKSAVWRVLTDNTVLLAVAHALPTIMVVVAIGFFIASIYYFRYNELDQGNSWTCTIIAIIVIFAMAGCVIMEANPEIRTQEVAATTSETEEESTTGDDFFAQNWVENDQNRVDSDFQKKLARRAADTGTITAKMVKKEILISCRKDARMLAIWANAFELWEDPNDYEELLTKDKKYLSKKGQDLYYKVEGAMATITAKREKAPATGVNSGYSNNTFGYASSNGISGDRSGTKFSTKSGGIEFWVMDRCANIVRPSRPSGSPKVKTDNPKPKKKGKGDPTPTPTPTPNPPTPPKKDPSQGSKINTEPNKGKGKGSVPTPPKNGTTKQKDSKEYNKAVQEMKKVQETQKTGSDSNTPSTPPPTPSTKVDNNGDKGTGHGGANTPTPVQDKAREADTGKPIDDTPGEKWEGPAD